MQIQIIIFIGGERTVLLAEEFQLINVEGVMERESCIR